MASVKHVAIQYNQNMLLTITSLVMNNNSLIKVNTNTSKIWVEQYKFDPLDHVIYQNMTTATVYTYSYRAY